MSHLLTDRNNISITKHKRYRVYFSILISLPNVNMFVSYLVFVYYVCKRERNYQLVNFQEHYALDIKMTESNSPFQMVPNGPNKLRYRKRQVDI